jgi:hypothetical protein
MADNDTMDVDEQPVVKGKKEAKDSGKARFEVKKVKPVLVLSVENAEANMYLTI